MISDVLFEAESDIVNYLHVCEFYYGPLRKRIESLLEEMDAVRRLPNTDLPPGWPEQPRRTAAEIIESFRRINLDSIPDPTGFPK